MFTAVAFLEPNWLSGIEQTRVIPSITNSCNNLHNTDETIIGRYELRLFLFFPFLGTGVTTPAQK